MAPGRSLWRSPGARLSLGLLVTVVLLAGGAAAFMAATRSAAPTSPTAAVTRGDYTDVVELRGDIRPVKSVIITAPTQSGELQILTIAKTASVVKKGDVVIEFDAITAKRMTLEAQSALRSAMAELEQARAQSNITDQQNGTALLKAGYDVQRAKLDIGVPELVSRVDAERTKLNVADAELRLKEIEARDRAAKVAASNDFIARQRKIDKVKADLELAQRSSQNLNAVAPADGVVSVFQNFRNSEMRGGALEFRPGDRVWAGAQIMELPDLSSVLLAARLEETDRGQLKTGQAATIRVDAVADHEYQAVVADVSLLARADFSSGWPPSKNFDLKLKITDADARLRPGMSAAARIAVGRIPDVLIVPSAAVFTVNGRAVVYRLSGRTFEPVEIEIVKRGREQAALRGPLQAGDRVALTKPDTAGQRK